MTEILNISATILSLNSLSLKIILPLVGILIIIGINVLLYHRLKKNSGPGNVDEVIKEKELLEQLFNNMPDRIYFKDRESRFILANKYVSQIMGEKDPKKLVGKTDFDFYEEKFARGYYEDEQRLMEEGRAMISKEEKGLDLNGTEIFVSTTKIPIRDKHKNVIGIIGIGRDITPQKDAEAKLQEKSESLKEINVLLEERQEEIQQMAEELNAQAEHLKQINVQLERLSLVASKTENTVIIMDGNGNFEWVNEGFEKRYGMDIEQFQNEYGKNLRENSSNDNISAVLNQIYITQKPYTYNSKFIDKNGVEYWSQTNITPILNTNKEIINLILIDSDVTELKNAESRIKKQNAEIEAQSAELKKINKTKDRLFSIIAHDLKNPFHSIMGFTEILQNKYKDIEREKLNEYLEMISTSTRSAYQLLENLLDWARTQTEKVTFKPEIVSVWEITEEIIALDTLQASAKNIAFLNNIPKEVQAYADRNMLNTVLRNLASNAIKFSESGGSVTFDASKISERTIINVADTGIGIPAEKLNSLFQLDKVKSTAGTAGESGTGLGLIVVNEFLQKNNGTISVSSKAGKGSKFSISLPSEEV